MPMISANERFRKVRKLVTTEMRTSAVTQYFNPIQTVEVQRLVKVNLLHRRLRRVLNASTVHSGESFAMENICSTGNCICSKYIAFFVR